MKTFQKFPTSHSDFLHDVSFNYYGNRLATCSSDRKIKVWELLDEESLAATCNSSSSSSCERNISTSPWKLAHEWTAHQGSVFKVTWAHPEYGQILASCSFDRTVCIWEEQSSPNTSSWRNHAQLVDSRESVQDLAFAPRHLGLRLASASADGYVRMYEATDIMNLGHWPLQEEFLAEKDGISCIAWNTSPFDVPMIVVGGNVVHSSNHTNQGPHMTNPGSSALDSSGNSSRRISSASATSASSPSGGNAGENQMPGAKVWGYNSTYNRWQILAELRGHQQGIHDVAWANNMGRSYHLIATTSRDRTLRIWKLTLRESQFQYDVKQMAVLHHEEAEVWKVEWNITGTMLSSSGDDGIVRLWKSDFDGNWICVSTIAGDMTSSSTAR